MRSDDEVIARNPSEELALVISLHLFIKAKLIPLDPLDSIIELELNTAPSSFSFALPSH